nr:phosphotransferase family protein [Neobacillus sp. Marseille-Q6967]
MAHSLQKLKDNIQYYLKERMFPDEWFEIEGFTQASGGWTDETYVFSVKTKQQTTGLVLRKLKKGSLLSEERSLNPQFRLLDQLSRSTTLPVPKVYFLEEDESIIDGEFIIMEKLKGTSYVPWSKEGRSFLTNASETTEIPKQFAEHLITLHNFPYREFGIQDILQEPSEGKGFIERKLAELEGLYLKYKIIYDPVMTDALEWLKQHQPNAQRLSIIHGDYRTGNILYDRQNISGILDWEAAEIGDPLMDVAYICAKANRMDSSLLCYLLDKDWFLQYYSEKTGLKVNEQDLHYYEVLHQVRFLLLSLSAAYSFEKQQTTDIRMARQGYRWTMMRHMLAETLGY